MPLTMVVPGNEVVITRINAQGKTDKHLRSLGLTEGAKVSVIAEQNGDLILRVLDSRVAINKALAMSLTVERAA